MTTLESEGALGSNEKCEIIAPKWLQDCTEHQPNVWLVVSGVRSVTIKVVPQLTTMCFKSHMGL